MSEFEKDALGSILANAALAPPVLVMVRDTSRQTEVRGSQLESDLVGSAWPAKLALRVAIDLSHPAERGNSVEIWAALDTLSNDIRRLQLLRRIERSKQGSGWRSASWQAAKAAGRLTKGLLSRRV